MDFARRCHVIVELSFRIFELMIDTIALQVSGSNDIGLSLDDMV